MLYALSDSCVNTMAVKMHYISRVMHSKKVSKANMTFMLTQDHLDSFHLIECT